MKEIMTAKIVLSEIEDFYLAKYKGDEIKVRINDFPDEIMYTVYFRGESFDIDDLPDSWKIDYEGGISDGGG